MAAEKTHAIRITVNKHSKHTIYRLLNQEGVKSPIHLLLQTHLETVARSGYNADALFKWDQTQEKFIIRVSFPSVA